MVSSKGLTEADLSFRFENPDGYGLKRAHAAPRDVSLSPFPEASVSTFGRVLECSVSELGFTSR